MRLSIAAALAGASLLVGGRELVAVSAYAGTQKLPPSPDPLHTVRIDAIASDARGDVVRDLTAADFELSEGGVSRPIESVQFSRPSGRLFAIFLDEYHVTPGASTSRAREALTRFVSEELGPDDLVAVMKPLDSLFAIRPTLDRESVGQAIRAFEGRKGEYMPRNAYETSFIAGNPARIEAARLQLVISAINALASDLGRMDDSRKTLIVVTEALGRPLRTRGREYLTTVDTVIRSANKSNVSIYAVDPREAPSVDAVDAPGREAVRAIAAETVGATIAAADLGAALRPIARDSSGYYLLTYRAPHKEDGAFHPVQVRVKRPGVQVRARAGYWAPSSDDELRASLAARARQPEPAPRIEPIRRSSPLIRPWFGLSRGENGKTRVTFVWEAVARVPGDREARYPSRIVLTVLGADDSLLFEGPVLPTGTTMFTEQGGVAARAVFDAPPGDVRLRMKIEDEAARQMDSDVRDLVIRDWRAAVAIGTPEVLRARNAREFRFLDADPQATPVASREFSRTERLLVRFAAYAPPGAQPRLTARLLGRSGDRLRELKVEASSTSEGQHHIDVQLASLAPGEYAIELAAASSAGEAKDRLQFRVTH